MLLKKINLVLFLWLICCANSYADIQRPPHPFYAGLSYGYGKTTWEYLVPDETNVALAISTPIRAADGGAAWGAFIGYELISTFALELNYQRFPNADITFDKDSLLVYDYGVDHFTSKTETVSLLGKFMLFIPNTTARAFASTGIAEVHRADMIYNHWHLGPTFGFGVNKNITERVLAEINGNFTTGNGLSELDPAEHFIPFLWAINFRLAYRI